ncbi:SnoaL-like protein [Nocardioides sp. J9]|uniref:nuclear transport factor 2 family protein n=1 Tax=unclassified Nocardioides TaxID=2615069 RepID=UPI0004B3AFCF|nr:MULTISPECIES: nuclear transport factor 2 family protein [unclassified Nocardioides]TWH01492.1 SnoaL-like protein [Nocardioides sp. J9]
MSSTEERVAALEGLVAAQQERLRQMEDQQAIAQLIASYGPLVDAGEADRVAALWTEDGSYDVEDWHMADRAAVAAMVRSDAHQGLISRGSAHFLGPAHVSVDGDTAVAVCESVLVVQQERHPVVARIAANLFELARTPEGWRITRRTTRGLRGTREAHDLLAGRVPTD